jgi:hypothetical protein
MAWDDEATGQFGAQPGIWPDTTVPSAWNTMEPPSSSWWTDPKTAEELKGLSQGLGGVKPLADTGSGMPARPPYPAAGIHQGAPIDALGQYLQMLQARQQQLRGQFLPKTAGLLGG